MASFDFVESASNGYKFLWDERDLILRLAMVPFAIKLVSFIGVTGIDFQDNYLRQGLFLLPSYAAEGWLVMQLIRFAIFGERGQVNLSGNDDQDIKADYARQRGIMAGTLIYVLIKLFLSFFSSLVLMGGEMQSAVKPAEITDSQAFFVGLATFMLMIWGFRLIWLYIPAALDYPIRGFMRKIKSFATSFSMIGLWLLSFVPIMLLLIIFSEILATIFPGAEEAEPSVFYKYGMAVVQGGLDMVIAIVSSVGMAYGIQSIYEGKNRPTPIF